MDPLVRQTSLEILLRHYQELSADELKQALHLGLTDPDLHINQIAWKFVYREKKVDEFIQELEGVVSRLQKAGDTFSINFARAISKSMKKS